MLPLLKKPIANLLPSSTKITLESDGFAPLYQTIAVLASVVKPAAFINVLPSNFILCAPIPVSATI